MAVRTELPQIYIDLVDVDTDAARPVLLNRNPQPNAVDVPVGSNVSVDIVDHTGLAQDVSEIEVYIGDAALVAAKDGSTLAYDGDGGGFQTGFDGPGSSSADVAPGTSIRRIIVDPTSAFVSEAVISVRVISESTDASAIDETYTFTVEDVTAPQLISAELVDLRTVDLIFDDPLRRDDPAGPVDALNVTNYFVTKLDAEAVSPTVQGVIALAADRIRVRLDLHMTLNATYEFRVENVVNEASITIDALAKSVNVQAIAPDRPADRSFDYWRMMPKKNRREDTSGDLRKFCTVIQDTLDVLLDGIDRFHRTFDKDLADEVYVDAMLCDLADEFTHRFNLSLDDRRRVIDVLIPIRKQKGSRKGIINTIRFFVGIEVTIESYSDPENELGVSRLGDGFLLSAEQRFRLFAFNVVAPVSLTDEQRSQIRFLANTVKPAREHYVDLDEPLPPGAMYLDTSELGGPTTIGTWTLS